MAQEGLMEGWKDVVEARMGERINNSKDISYGSFLKYIYSHIWKELKWSYHIIPLLDISSQQINSPVTGIGYLP